MKILHVITGLRAGGAERALYNILVGGLAHEFDNYVLSLSDYGVYGDLIKKLDVPVEMLNLRGGLQVPGAIWKLRHLAREIMPDVVQGWMYHGNLAATVIGYLAKHKPVMVWGIRQSLYGLEGEKPMTRYVIRANKLLSRIPKAIIYNSRLSREQHEAFGFTPQQGRVIPNGFDLGCWKPNPHRGEELRKILGIPDSARVVGHVARFHPMKNHPFFLRSAVRVASELPDVHFILSGRGVSFDNLTLASMVPEQFRLRFHMLGERRDIPDLMQTMDVFCQSSWSEAFPNVLGEAMATGVPCVATDVGDSALIVGDTGVIVPRHNEDALFGGMMELLNKTAAERTNFGQAARKRIEENYSLDAAVTQYARLYWHLINCKQIK